MLSIHKTLILALHAYICAALACSTHHPAYTSNADFMINEYESSIFDSAELYTFDYESSILQTL